MHNEARVFYTAISFLELKRRRDLPIHCMKR